MLIDLIQSAEGLRPKKKKRKKERKEKKKKLSLLIEEGILPQVRNCSPARVSACSMSYGFPTQMAAVT